MKFNDSFKNLFKLCISVSIITVLAFFILLKFDAVTAWFSDLWSMLFPFIFGFVLAFLLDKPMMLIEKNLKKLGLKGKSVRPISAICALLFGIVIVVLFVALVLPQLWESVMLLVEQAPGYAESFVKIIEDFIVRYHIDLSFLEEAFGGKNFEQEMITKVTTFITQFFTSSIPTVVVIGTRVTSTLINVFVGIIAGLYLMLDKEQFIKAIKSCVYAFFKPTTADYLCRFTRISEDIFNGFIIGKALDSLIIGIITYILMYLFQMPYALLLSVLIGITNMIPVFGPFIGAVPGVFILTIIDWKLGLYFAIMILAIQQFDGNILGPLILGDKLGLPSLAILFSVVVFGGIFGIVGMIIGVPIFAVIYTAVKELVDDLLKKKKIVIE